MGKEQGQGGELEVAPPLEGALAKAVERRTSCSRLRTATWADILGSCLSISQTGCCLAWLLVNAEELAVFQQNSKWVESVFAFGAWPRARRRRQALPIGEGDLRSLREQLESHSLEEVRASNFTTKWSETAWTMLACFACNSLAGHQRPLTAGPWTKMEKKMAAAVGASTKRLMAHGGVTNTELVSLEKELKSRRVSYTGEEIGVCHVLTLEQVLPSLPPSEHGGAIDILKYVSKSTRYFLCNPQKMVVKDTGQDLPKLQGKIHVEKGNEIFLAKELVRRNVCRWIPLSKVLQYRGQRVLNGLFGVEKPTVLPSGKSVLRLIMNLVPSNAVLKSFQGAVQNLPHITSWMSTVLEDGQQLKVWQSDMTNAFYLFRIPDSWGPLLSFNIVASGQEIGNGSADEQFALSCAVLPMGWASSVAIMQEASEQILELGSLPQEEQLSRGRLLPTWMAGIMDEAKRTERSWWHVYLDNFAAGEVTKDFEHGLGGDRLHQLAERAWAEAGVQSSAKKRKSAVMDAQELGAFLDGQGQWMGASPDRLLRLIQATLVLLKEPHLSKKLTQVVAGRWVHVLQFRRPAMSLLEATWTFISSKKFELALTRKVRRELFSCCCAVPLLHTFLGAGVSEVMTASDASQKGGAVGISRELTTVGKDFTSASIQEKNAVQSEILLVSLFNGIGGAIRCYDILGVSPRAIIAYDTHGPANRVTGKRWPHAELHSDVRSITEEVVDGWYRKTVPLEEVHLWAGFPCTDLSSAKAGREGLRGEASGLFWEVVRVKELLKRRAPAHVVVKFVAENVASMDKNECSTITEELEVFPYWLNSSDAVPMNRPRLCWTSEEIEGVLDGLTFEEKSHWTEVRAPAPYPEETQWLTEGACWPGGADGTVFPTAMKAIVRHRPPPRPAGLNRCDNDTLNRWRADKYRFPPYHYLEQFVVWNGARWRLTNSSERELLLGYGFGHTKLCMSASDIKRSKENYEDEKLSLLGDSFSVYSFVIAAAALCVRYLPHLHYHHLARRMGSAPGFKPPLKWEIPLGRELKYGCPFPGDFAVQDLNRVLLCRVNHTGSDIRITTGQVLNPKGVPRQSVEAAWWRWLPSFKVRWQHAEHINVLELRAILLALKYQISHLGVTHCRLFHVSDSFVAMSVVAKGRTGSRQLGAVLKLLNAHLLAYGLYLIVGHIESTENPTDGASRQVALLHQDLAS